MKFRRKANDSSTKSLEDEMVYAIEDDAGSASHVLNPVHYPVSTKDISIPEEPSIYMIDIVPTGQLVSEILSAIAADELHYPVLAYTIADANLLATDLYHAWMCYVTERIKEYWSVGNPLDTESLNISTRVTYIGTLNMNLEGKDPYDSDFLSTPPVMIAGAVISDDHSNALPELRVIPLWYDKVWYDKDHSLRNRAYHYFMRIASDYEKKNPGACSISRTIMSYPQQMIGCTTPVTEGDLTTHAKLIERYSIHDDTEYFTFWDIGVHDVLGNEMRRFSIGTPTYMDLLSIIRALNADGYYKFTVADVTDMLKAVPLCDVKYVISTSEAPFAISFDPNTNKEILTGVDIVPPTYERTAIDKGGRIELDEKGDSPAMGKFKVFIYDNNQTYLDAVITAATKEEAETKGRQMAFAPANALATVVPLTDFNAMNK